jgi:vancomycin permeability regulator SanA
MDAMSHEPALPGKRRRRRAALVLALPVAAVLLHLGWIILDGFTDELAPSDVAVVLGNTVEPTGQPSARLAGRLDRADELFRAGTVQYVITSGGLGKEGFDEGAVMRDYLLARGLPPDRVIADSYGINTAATARNAARLMRERGWTSATAVSQYFHISRCKMAFRQAGIRTVHGAHARYFEPRDYPTLLRDYVAWWAYLLQNRAGNGQPAAVGEPG